MKVVWHSCDTKGQKCTRMEITGHCRPPIMWKGLYLETHRSGKTLVLQAAAERTRKLRRQKMLGAMLFHSHLLPKCSYHPLASYFFSYQS